MMTRLLPGETVPDGARIEPDAWDHEHCKRCGETIQPMTLCFVSTGDWEAILCEKCHEFVSATFVQRLLRKVGLPLILPRTTR